MKTSCSGLSRTFPSCGLCWDALGLGQVHGICPPLPRSVGWHYHIVLPVHTLLPPCFIYCTTQGVTGGCQVKENASCMQNQGGKGATERETACGERTVSLHMNCILPLRSSSLHCLRYDTKERYFNLRSSLSEGTNLGSWCLMFWSAWTDMSAGNAL